MAFSKVSPGQDAVLVVVNLNPFHWEEATLHLDLDALGVDPFHPFQVHDMLSDRTFVWHGAANYVKLPGIKKPGDPLPWMSGCSTVVAPIPFAR